MDQGNFRKAFLLLLVVAISATFLAMIRQFLMTILLAGIFSGLAYPLYSRVSNGLRGRRGLAAAATLLLLLVVVAGPILTVAGIVATEAFRVSESVRPWIQERVQEPGILMQSLERIPGFDKLAPYRTQILEKTGELVGSTGRFLFQRISDTTKGTVSFLFQFALLLYTMFFFLMDGDKLLNRILYYLPMPPEDEERMVDKFVSVTRATIKGTLFIGVLQGGLAGIALRVAGIDGALFWTTIMVVLSIVPGIGTALVWVPASIYLALTDQIVAGVVLAVFCGVVVGSIDNVLRPRLVGRDTQMHELLIFFGTLGGILLFGLLGFIVGPILAALFVTIWEIYGIVFRDVLPGVGSVGSIDSEADADVDPAG